MPRAAKMHDSESRTCIGGLIFALYPLVDDMPSLFETFALKQAMEHVAGFNRDPDIMAQHTEAMECRNCEAYLQYGIDCFEWIQRVRREIEQEIETGEAPPDLRADEAVQELYRGWLVPVPKALKWAELQQKRGFDVDTLDKFLECADSVRTIVERQDRMAALAARADSLDNLHLVAIPVPQEWREESPWTK